MALEIGGNYAQTVQEGRVANQWPYSGSDNQQWQLIQLAPELESQYTNRIFNANSDKVLRVRQANTSDGAQIEQGPYLYGCTTGSAYEEWYIRTLDNNYVAIINRNSGLALEIGGDYNQTLQAGRPANQWPYTGGDNQQWSEIYYQGGSRAFINRRSGMALAIDGSSTGDGALAVQQPYTGAANQLWNQTFGSSYFTSNPPAEQEVLRESSEQAKAQAINESSTRAKSPMPVTQELALYPNPASTIINLSLPDGEEIASVAITDMQGRKVVTSYANHGQLNVSSLSAGLYIINVQGEQHEYRQKFSKQ
jgi:hypothetical protein